jgi:hypothetical protein
MIGPFKTVITALLWIFLIPWLCGAASLIDSNLVLEIDGKKVFPIGFTMPPPPDGKTPEGRNAIAELADAGATFMRTGAQGGDWDEATIAREMAWLNAAHSNKIHCLPFLREHAAIRDAEGEQKLRAIVNKFKNHPGLGAWKGDDEPEWGKRPVEQVQRAYSVVKEIDPQHPMVLIHAPRGTVDSLREYNAAGDVLGADIYPIGYPPGMHSLSTNKTMSLVGEHTRLMMQVAKGEKPVWMVLQVAWSGVIKPGKTLRMPTFFEERFMTYQAIINGARGLLYFGGNLPQAMNERDKELGWNWKFWQRVLRPVIEEIGSHSPLYPALIAPDSGIKLQVRGEGMEWLVREANGALFLLACKTAGGTEQIEFSGMPADIQRGTILFEEPKSVEVTNGSFKDWFAPYEVHVYRFQMR